MSRHFEFVYAKLTIAQSVLFFPTVVIVMVVGIGLLITWRLKVANRLPSFHLNENDLPNMPSNVQVSFTKLYILASHDIT